ncbi:MAG: NAD(P)H-dependent oxidoreductase [Oscillospiraceae bacterium]|nr:NAD(P)H-dependent oxidoreductase [Oscillospiraceae bacterium]
MNVLVINGSPRSERSSSMKVTRAFLEGAGWENAEIIDVSKVNVSGCTGCYSCWEKTPGKCVIKDDMAEILPKIVEADVMITTFPLYGCYFPGQLKCFNDRMLPLAMPYMDKDAEAGGHPTRFDLSKLRAAYISTCGFWTAEGNYDLFEKLFARNGREVNYKEFCVFVGQGGLFDEMNIADEPELKEIIDEYLDIVRRAGKEFAAGKIEAETQKLLAEPMIPREIYEAAADSSWEVNEEDEKATASQECEKSTDVQAAASDEEDSLIATKEMAATYKHDGKERVLEMCYTDIDKTYQILLTEQGAEVITDNFKEYTTRIETPYSLWQAIGRGEVSGTMALLKRKYKVLGDMAIMMKWDKLFG